VLRDEVVDDSDSPRALSSPLVAPSKPVAMTVTFEGHVRAAGDVDQDAPGSLDRRFLEQRRGDSALRGLDGAVLALRDARAHEGHAQPGMIVFTSAKSRLISPGTVIRSEMPCTAWRRMSSAILKASLSDVPLHELRVAWTVVHRPSPRRNRVTISMTRSCCASDKSK
jgi:hypothetical protein